MAAKTTHRLVKNPTVSARDLADFMVASETAKRTIVRDCKYRPIARVTQHNEAKQTVSKFIRGGCLDSDALLSDAARLRSRIADSDFDRDLYDHNADYIERFANVYNTVEMPSADLLSPGASVPFHANGVKINPDIQFRLQRTTKTNKIRIGAGVLRYAKGRPVDPEVAAWHAAFVLGFLGQTAADDTIEAEHKLCLAVDAYAGIAYPAPGDAVRRFGNMLSACATIAERWPAIPPPPNSVLG